MPVLDDLSPIETASSMEMDTIVRFCPSISLYTLIQYTWPSLNRISGPGEVPLTRATPDFVRHDWVNCCSLTLRTACGVKDASWSILVAEVGRRNCFSTSIQVRYRSTSLHIHDLLLLLKQCAGDQTVSRMAQLTRERISAIRTISFQSTAGYLGTWIVNLVNPRIMTAPPGFE